MRTFEFVAVTPPGLADPSIAIAGSRAGGIGLLDLEFSQNEETAFKAVSRLARYANSDCGIKLDSRSEDFFAQITSRLPALVKVVVLTPGELDTLRRQVQILRQQNLRIFLQATNLEEARLGEEIGVDGIIAKGHEAGGWVGEETSFILLQHLLGSVRLPVWVQGGIGLHTVAACYAAGAAGAVMDAQLNLTRESPLPKPVKDAIASMDGSETVCLGSEFGRACRVYSRVGMSAAEELRRTAQSLELDERPARQIHALWRQAVRDRVGWNSQGGKAWLLGQDAAFAPSLAKRFATVGATLEGMRQAIDVHIRSVVALRPLAEGSPLARSHGTRYPILQGPMTRVSDRAEFALRVAEGGGLPFLALALMRAAEIKALLEETHRLLGERPWGVGILGFVPLDLRQEQLEAIKAYRPPFALIAGGRPDQALILEQQGIPTYLHVPSPGLLKMFLESGARRFVFEGRECGGHVGPRSSFVLWNIMIDVLLESLSESEMANCHVIFAGGIQDDVSASMVATLAAPLAKLGARLGVLLGTAYIFTVESVSTGAIVEGFQQEVIRCAQTVLLETGPGHSTRCVNSAYAEVFNQEKRRLSKEGRSAEETRNELEELNLGRLRIASKGIAHNPQHEHDPNSSRFLALSDAEQRLQGMYMIGQVAALRDRTCTIDELHHQVSVQGSERLGNLVEPAQARVLVPRQEQPCDIAIIGMACVLPKAPNLEAYWENILNKVDAITEVPANRWDWRLYFDPDPRARDKIYSKWGGFLNDVPFDPMQYGMPPNTLPSIEPLQLITLEVVRQALQDAGYTNRAFAREQTSVILGVGGGAGDLGQQYAIRSGLPLFVDNPSPEVWDRLPEWSEDSFAGILLNVTAGRVANRFDLGGVNYTVDAACASSLAAVYLATRELESGTSDMVIVGGADTVQNPFAYLCFSKTHALSPRGRCRTFDERADGIVISEGIGVLVLKRLVDAERDGDRIYAVIKAVAGSSDGRDKGLTAPRPEGQVRALDRAYAKAGFSPATVGLIEAHGTGTVAGDQAEVESLSRVFNAARALRQSCAIGSAKSMIGHTKCTAAVAGLIKVALALHHKVLPPTINVEKPNPKARFSESPFYVNTETRPWIHSVDDHPRRAGVSSFGFGGTNFHAVVEEYTGNFLEFIGEASLHNWPGELMLWAGSSRQELLESIESLEQALASGAMPVLRDLSYTLWKVATERNSANGLSLLHLTLVTDSLEDFRKKLALAAERLRSGEASIEDHRGIYYTESPLADGGKIAFLFPGQGSQYVDMLRELTGYFPEVRQRFEIADRVLAHLLPRSLSSHVFPPPRFSQDEERTCQQSLTYTTIAQPALGAADLGLCYLLQCFGIKPGMVAGHSYGEYVALCSAGVFSEQLLYTLSEARGRFITESGSQDLGTMAAVSERRERVAEILDSVEGIWIANVNAPQQTVISGTRQGVEKAVKRLEACGVQARPIPVACAFHSPLIAQARDRLAQLLSMYELSTPEVEVFSNTTAAPYPTESKGIVTILADHLVQPVNFLGQVEAMYQAGARIFVEVGPRNILTGLTEQILAERKYLAVASDIAGRSGFIQLLHLLSRLATHGVPIQLDRLYQGRTVRKLNLKALDEEVREKPLAPTTWLVNGGGARPLLNSSDTRKTSRQESIVTNGKNGSVHTTDLKTQVVPNVASSPAAVPAETKPSSTTRGPTSTSSERAVNSDNAMVQVMMQYQKLMNRFLETQKETMLAYLQGPSEIGSSLQPLVGLAAQPEELKVKSNHVASPSIVDPVAESMTVTIEPSKPKPVMQQGLRTSADKEQLTKLLLQIVGDRTGYPPEMLDLDLNIEADLGIDSIKRVEILGAFQRACFPSGQQGQEAMEKLTGIRTLRGVIDLIHSSLQSLSEVAAEEPPKEQVEPAVAQPVQDKEQLTKLLLQIVGDRTGYPPEMLDLDLNIEADLGIDSIKRVEILGAFQRACFPSGQQGQEAMEQITGIRTLRGIIDWVYSVMNSGTQAESLPVDGTEGTKDGTEKKVKAEETGVRETSQETEVPRFTITTSETSPLHSNLPRLKGVFLITNDGEGLGEAMVEKLRGMGALPILIETTGDWASVRGQVEHARQGQGSIQGLIHLAPLKRGKSFEEMSLCEWRERLALEVKSLFYLANAAGADLQAYSRDGAYVMAAVDLWGVTERLMSPGHSGVSGLVKTLAVEWPEVRCRVVELKPNPDRTAMAELLLREMGSQDREIEVSYRDSRRQVVRAKTVPLAESASGLAIDSNSVVLITGGARGITAEVACELAVRYRPKLVLVGRSSLPEPEESSETIGLNSPQELKRALVEQRQRLGQVVTPVDIEKAYHRLLKDREMRRTFAAARESGASLRYYSVDVRDEEAFGRVLREIYQAYGRIDGVVHGAGIIEDKLVVDKAPDSFDRVFDTKADSAFILSRTLRPDSLKFLVLFSSVAGCFGNRGQADYAAANEVLNKVALCLDSQWPGRVVSINWGPWEKAGMVSKEVQQQFAKRGVQLIPPVGGRKAFDQEIRFGRKGETIIILGDGPWKDMPPPQPSLVPASLPLFSKAPIKSSGGSAFEIAFTLDARDHYLQDHRLDDKPVFPAAMAVELMAEAVQRGWPELEIVGIRSMRVLQGIVLDEDRREIHVVARPQTDPGHESLSLEVDVEICESTARGRPSYRATVHLADRLPSSPPFNLKPFANLQPFPMGVKEAYSRWLFHGPSFEGIGQIEGINENGIVALIASCPPSKCLTGNGQPGRWLIDPVLMDCGFQLAILWERYYHDMTPLPSRFTSYRRFGTLSASNVRCFLHAKTANAGHTLLTDIVFTDCSGRILGLLEEMEFSCSKSLNRLARCPSGEQAEPS